MPESSERPLLRLQGVRHGFELGDGRAVPALRLDALEIRAGQRLAVRGPNGSGKTTLMNVIAGLVRPLAGDVELEGSMIYELSEARRDRLRARKIGYVLQSLCLIEALTAYENVLCAARFGTAFPRRLQPERTREILTRFGLGARLNHRPSQLSTGEQQRVAAARALVNQPALVLCDEPTASLDERGSRLLLEDLDRHCTEHGAALIVASHDATVLARFPTLQLDPPGDTA